MVSSNVTGVFVSVEAGGVTLRGVIVEDEFVNLACAETNMLIKMKQRLAINLALGEDFIFILLLC
jgi:hypothetical protein